MKDDQVPEPEIVTMDKRRIAGISREYDMASRGDIPRQWADFEGAGLGIVTAETEAMYGVSYGADGQGNFSYHVGAPVGAGFALPEGACCVTLRGGTYAVFRKVAPVSELPPLFDHVFSTWLPGSDWRQEEGAVFERYPEGEDVPAGEMAFEIWVPVRER